VTDNQKTEFKLGLQVLRTFKTQANRHHFAMGEFIDNSVQSYIDNKKQLLKIPGYKPNINIEVGKNEILISDNCAGIPEDMEQRAFDIGNPNPNASGIGTYGMGMKVSACWYSDTWQVETKAINEDVIKIWKIDINKIVDKKDLDIGPERKTAKNTEPYTRIKLNNLHRYPTGNAVKNLKDKIVHMYKWFILDKEIDFIYNGIKLTVPPPEYKVISTYPHSVEKPKIEWFTEIPKLDLGDGYFVQGAAYLANSKIDHQIGFAMYWKGRLIEGSWSNPWMPKVSDYEDPIDQKKYGIYQGENREINQRLEGWLHISDNFDVVHTKNQVIWAGKEEILKEKLKSYLQNAIIYKDESGEVYDFIYQAKNAKYSWDPSKNPPSGGEGPTFPKTPGGGGTIPIPPIPPRPTPSPAPPKIPEGEVVNFTYEETKWKVTIIEIQNPHNDFVTHIDGPEEDKESGQISIGIKVNLGHENIHKYFINSGGDLAVEGIKKLAVAVILSQLIAQKNSAGRASAMVRIFNHLLSQDSFG